MWIFLNDAFLSAVESNDNPKNLVVRARCRDDLERVFPKKKIIRNPDADYLFRVVVTREEFATAIGHRIGLLDYGNFKDSVKEKDRKDAYLKVWTAMLGLQLSRYPGVAKALRSAATWARDSWRPRFKHDA